MENINFIKGNHLFALETAYIYFVPDNQGHILLETPQGIFGIEALTVSSGNFLGIGGGYKNIEWKSNKGIERFWKVKHTDDNPTYEPGTEVGQFNGKRISVDGENYLGITWEHKYRDLLNTIDGNVHQDTIFNAYVKVTEVTNVNPSGNSTNIDDFVKSVLGSTTAPQAGATGMNSLSQTQTNYIVGGILLGFVIWVILKIRSHSQVAYQ